MIRPARIVGFAAIALAAFGTAASIAAIGGQSDLGPVRYSDLKRIEPVRVADVAPVSADPLAACSITLLPSETADAEPAGPIAFDLATGETMDLDIPGASGFSVACGAGIGLDAAAGAELSEVDLSKGDSLAGL